MTNFGEVLETARRACGLTQEELAAAAAISQGAMSRYETGQREPDDEVLKKLAAALGVTSEFLIRAGRVRGGMAVEAHMRRRQTVKPTLWRQLEARLNLYRMHTRMLYEEVAVRAEQSVPRLDIVETDPVTAARVVRMQWRMPVGPVRNLVAWLEAAGCVVIEEDFGTARVDGLSQWIDDYPIIMINWRSPTDRKRLTLAHELGHLVLHSLDIGPDAEVEANAFAGEFLMPTEFIRPQLRTLNLGKLHDLKREWSVSMQALIERAKELRLISTTQRTNLYKSLSSRGWRTSEPLSDELPPESPSLTRQIGSALAARGHTEQEIARLAGFDESVTRHPFNPRPSALRLVADSSSRAYSKDRFSWDPVVGAEHLPR